MKKKYYYRVDLTKHDNYCYIKAGSKKEANDKALDENPEYDFAYVEKITKIEYKKVKNLYNKSLNEIRTLNDREKKIK